MLSQDQTQPAQTQPVFSPNGEQVSITVYQGGNAVVREKRVVDLVEGRNEVHIHGLPLTYAENSMTLDTVEGDGQFKQGPMTYHPATLSQQNIWKGSIGRRIKILRQLPTGNSTHADGILRHIIGNNSLVLDCAGKIRVVQMQPDFEVDGEMPSGLTDLASMVMRPTVTQSGRFGMNILYQASGIDWAARYELIYNSKTERIERLICWVDLDNASGASFDDATLKLFASQNIAPGGRRMRPMMAMSKSRGMEETATAMSLGGAPAADVSFESAQVQRVGEQYMYELPDRVSLKADEPTTNAILIWNTDIPTTPDYRLQSGSYTLVQAGATAQKLPIFNKVRAINSAESNLGVPMPAAPMSIFERDQSNELQQLDGSSISQHVEINEPFDFSLSKPVWGLKATRTITGYHVDDLEYEEIEVEVEETPKRNPVPAITSMMAESAMITPVVPPGFKLVPVEKRRVEKPRFRTETRELTLFNYRDQTKEIKVQESLPHGATMLDSNLEFPELTNYSAELTFQVPSGGTTQLRYTIKWQINKR